MNIEQTPFDPLFGALIKVKYVSAHGQVLRVVAVERNCTCPTYESEINHLFGDPEPARTTPHFHFVGVPADLPHSDHYPDCEYRFLGQIIEFGGGRFWDIPEGRDWNWRHFVSRIIGLDRGPMEQRQGDLF